MDSQYTTINLASDDSDDSGIWDRTKDKTVSYWKSFKKFLNSRGDILSLAVAFIIARSFQAIVTSLVDDILMPPFGLLPGANLENWFYILKSGKTVNATYTTVKEAQIDGAVTENIGPFTLTIVNFIVVALFLWITVQIICGIKEKLRIEHENKTTKTCALCKELIHIEATRCKWCCSDLG
jgi:large conductance mechanosensitive channel